MLNRKRLLRGASSIEYGVLVGLVSVVAISSVYAVGGEVSAVFESAAVAQKNAGGETAPGPAPSDPYDGWLDESTFLIGTPASDTLDLGVGGPWPGVWGKEDDDTMHGTSGSEIFIGAPGNDAMHGWAGDDVFVYASGDGEDNINEDIGGSDRIIFTDIASTDAKFFAKHHGGASLRIEVPGGFVQIPMHYHSSPYDMESIEFSDGVTYNLEQAADKAAHDGKSLGTVHSTRFDEDIVHREGDGSYTIKENTSPANTMTFAETSYADATFQATSSGSSLRTTTVSGDVVTIDYYLSDSVGMNMSKWAQLNFSDQARPALNDFLRRVAEDAKPTGTVNFTAFDDSMRHWASADAGYDITGQWGGLDELHFMETTFEDARFDVYSTSELRITDAMGNRIDIPTFFHTTAGNWIESITFNAGAQTPTFDQIRDRAVNDQKSGTEVELTNFDDEVRHQRSQGNYDYRITGRNGIDTLRFLETNESDVTFSQYWNDLRIHLPDGDRVTINDYIDYADTMEHIYFNGTELSRADILARI
jgi:Flp pilus assembly pilin Flp